MSDATFEWVRSRFAEVLEVESAEVQPDSRFADDLDADSIDLIEVVNGAEKEFGVVVEEHELYDLETVQELVDLLERSRK